MKSSWDPIWENIFSSRSWGRWPAEDVVRATSIEFANRDKSKSRILEVGCGTGANLWFFAKEGYQTYGIDGSRTAIEKAEKAIKSEVSNWQGELSVGDIGNLPFQDNFFDMVVDVEAIYANSFESSVKIYREIARVLKPGGKVYSRTFAAGTWGSSNDFKEGTMKEGPMAGMGYTRLTSYEEIPTLIGDSYQIESIDLITRSMNGDIKKRVVKEWLIKAAKRTDSIG